MKETNIREVRFNQDEVLEALGIKIDKDKEIIRYMSYSSIRGEMVIEIIDKEGNQSDKQ